ncbi:hypothetical protein WICPIJ_006784 [Wickerhamomyces pijperi]|uniref:RNI-like protein n=1 Tax=Wickerhamomyces pijperi TaxID=599730 RepID=A0A9P8Q327_WICPI|nr:hypothetical protein WICPIJ_006784 [Wickerhamomyces pijperi]
MPQDQFKKSLQRGVDNVEVDWFLRGKLPEFSASESHPYTHTHANPSSGATTPGAPGTPATANGASTGVSSATTATTFDTASSPSMAVNNQNGNVLTRSKSISYRELQQIKNDEPVKKKQGFFHSLFKSKKKEPEPPVKPKIEQKPVQTPTNSVQSIHDQLPPKSNNVSELRRTKSLSIDHAQLDPKLTEFLRYYKAKGIPQLQSDLHPPAVSDSTSTLTSQQTTIAETLEAKAKAKKPIITVDCLGRPIPPHPDLSPSTRSAFAKNPRFNTVKSPVEKQHPTSQDSSHSKLSFLKRVKSTQSDIQSVTSLNSTISNSSSVTKPLTIPGLSDLPPLKRVSFSIPVFFNDPPQQIPSRTPRKGEVEVCKDGTIVIHKLSVAEKRKIMLSQGGGVVVGGSGCLKIINDHGGSTEMDESEGSTLKESQEPHTEEPTKQEIINSAHVKAEESASELKRTPTNTEEDVLVSQEASKISIDKPMAHSSKSTTSLMSLGEDETQDEVYPPPSTRVPLDVLYTRCCHLREILPIPATLKQLRQGSFDPIPLLQLRNPKPSLVEILTFADFISIAPILCISLDGVSLSVEMFRIILSALVSKPELEKITLRNTALDEEGWRLLCWFLTKNHTVSRLDLSMVPSLSTNVQKPAKSSSTGVQVQRMTCDLTGRGDMSWSLLNVAIMSRNGIDEIVLNGGMIPEDQFKDLFELGLRIKSTKIGLAYNRLSLKQCQVLGDCINWNEIIGLDLGYNDLTGGKLKALKIKKAGDQGGVLRFISLNSTGLTEGEEIENFISDLIGFKELRYLDLSNNPGLFPGVIGCLSENLPLFENLSRFHVDYNGLSTPAIIAISELIPFCKRLSYFSMMGNNLDSVSGLSLTSAMKVSNSVITLDIEYEQLPLKTREEIAVYTMRNMKNQVNDGKGASDHLELLTLQEQLLELIHSGGVDSALVGDFIKRITTVRAKIHESIEELFKQRVQGGLNLEGKEALIRFCFIDSSIEKGLKLLTKKLNISPSEFPQDGKDDEIIHSKLKAPTMSRQTSLSEYVDSQGHTELFPFGVVTNQHETVNPEEDGLGLNYGDSKQARAADDFHLKEEASVLKLTSLLKNNKSVMRDEIPQEHIDAMLSVSGDKLKEALLKTNNIQDLVGVLDSFKEQGIALGEIYKKKDPSDQNYYKPGKLELETRFNTNSNSIGENVQCCVVDSKHRKKFSFGADEDTDTESEESDSDTVSDFSKEEEEAKAEEEQAEQEKKEKQIEKVKGEADIAYDQVLDHLERVRTNG